MTKNFDELARPILDDPIRAARVEQFADEALQAVIEFQKSEQGDAAEDLADRRELDLPRAESDFIPWEEVKVNLGLD
jgi:hypothetical protein